MTYPCYTRFCHYFHLPHFSSYSGCDGSSHVGVGPGHVHPVWYCCLSHPFHLYEKPGHLWYQGSKEEAWQQLPCQEWSGWLCHSHDDILPCYLHLPLHMGESMESYSVHGTLYFVLHLCGAYLEEWSCIKYTITKFRSSAKLILHVFSKASNTYFT